jgi:hypothetical protein
MKPRCQTPRSAQAGMTPELDGQAVVVTGGSAGVGLVSARAAREEDAGVILAARNPERLDRPHRRSARAARPPSTRSTRLRSTGSSPTTLSRSTTRSSASGPKYRSKSPRPHPRRPTANGHRPRCQPREGSPTRAVQLADRSGPTNPIRRRVARQAAEDRGRLATCSTYSDPSRLPASCRRSWRTARSSANAPWRRCRPAERSGPSALPLVAHSSSAAASARVA